MSYHTALVVLSFLALSYALDDSVPTTLFSDDTGAVIAGTEKGNVFRQVDISHQ